jgi:small subunit ribosomal protein S1
MKQLASDPWETDIPERYKPKQIVKGKVTKITNFGVFVELEPGLEGLLHVSELADDKVGSPEDVVKVGDTIDVKVLKVDREERKIGLSRKTTTTDDEEEIEETASEAAKAKEKELKGGMSGAGGQLFTLPGAKQEE